MREKLLHHAPWLLAALATVALGKRALAAFAAHNAQWAHDLAFFDQILFNAAQGRAWTSPLLLEPLGFFEMVHFHPVFAALLPLWMLRPEPSTLLLFNVAAVCFAAVPLAGLARDRSGSDWFGLAAAVAFLCWLPVQTAALADFRPVVFFIPGFLLLLRGAARPSRAMLVAGALLVASAREESGYLLPLMALVLLVVPFGRRRRSDALILLGLGLGWLVFLLAFKGSFFYHFNPVAFLQGLGQGDPVPAQATADRLRHLGLLLASGFGPQLLSPAMLLMLAPQVGFLMLDTHREWHAFTGTYPYLRHALLPFMAAGGVMGWAWLVERARLERRRETLALAIVGMVLGNALAFHHERERLDGALWQRNAELAAAVETKALDLLLAEVPPEARVVTDYRLVADLAGRRVLWVSAHLYNDGGAPAGWPGPWPLTLDFVDTVLVPQDDPLLARLDDAWEFQDRAGEYVLWRRLRDPEGGYPAAVP
ncbi:MAG: DUF2079 domain-containing protein [Pseudomonadota bacterium]